jgi:YD repeat-containing protein
MEISPMPTTTMGYDPALRMISKRDAEKQKKM